MGLGGDELRMLENHVQFDSDARLSAAKAQERPSDARARIVRIPQEAPDRSALLKDLLAGDSNAVRDYLDVLAERPRLEEWLYARERGNQGLCLGLESPGGGILICISPASSKKRVRRVGAVAPRLEATAPHGRASPDDEAADQETVDALNQLIREASLRDRPCFFQALIPEGDGWAARTLHAAGFRYATQLHFLRCDSLPTGQPGKVAVPEARFGVFKADHAGWAWEPYHSSRHSEFLRCLEKSFEASSDCPLLTRLRSPAQAFAAHAASGDSETRHWWLLRRGLDAVGLLLLAVHDRSGELEILYMGLATPYRGMGAGSLLLEKAFSTACALRLGRVRTAVDRDNAAARHLYKKYGFLPTLMLEAWFADAACRKT